eukprot:965273-Alexandrium_andersonii.AAC.1
MLQLPRAAALSAHGRSKKGAGKARSTSKRAGGEGTAGAGGRRSPEPEVVAGRAAGDSASVALATGSRPTVRARSRWALVHGTPPAGVEQHE